MSDTDHETRARAFFDRIEQVLVENFNIKDTHASTLFAARTTLLRELQDLMATEFRRGQQNEAARIRAALQTLEQSLAR